MIRLMILILTAAMVVPALAQELPPPPSQEMEVECGRLGLNPDQCATMHALNLWEQERQRASELETELDAQAAEVVEPVEVAQPPQQAHARPSHPRPAPPRQKVVAMIYQQALLDPPGLVNGRTFADYREDGFAYNLVNKTHDVLIVRGTTIGRGYQEFYVYFEQPPPHRLLVQKVTLSPSGVPTVTHEGYIRLNAAQTGREIEICDSIFQSVNR